MKLLLLYHRGTRASAKGEKMGGEGCHSQGKKSTCFIGCSVVEVGGSLSPQFLVTRKDPFFYWKFDNTKSSGKLVIIGILGSQTKVSTFVYLHMHLSDQNPGYFLYIKDCTTQL